MSERFKYAVNGVYKCEDFEQHLVSGLFPQHTIGCTWWNSRLYITFKIQEGNNQVYPYIACTRKSNIKIRAFFNIKTKFWSLCYQTKGSIYLESDAGVSGPSINIQDILNEENGYLENGALTVEYGFHMDTIIKFGSIWAFNLNIKLFNSDKENNTVTLQDRFGRRVCHSPKPLLAFHSSFHFQPNRNVIQQVHDGSYVKQCLQIANGVRLQYPRYNACEWFGIAEAGRRLNMMNVVHYCDSMIIRTRVYLLNDENNRKTAVKLNMRQCVAFMIKLWDFKELLEELRDDSDEITGEMMKVLVARFIKEKF
ncbi:unnamed protein product [Caenorhabditis brenneri]